jgi:hypothetical protein
MACECGGRCESPGVTKSLLLASVMPLLAVKEALP